MWMDTRPDGRDIMGDWIKQFNPDADAESAKRQAYWLHFIERWAVWGEGGGHGVTGPRLRNLYEVVMADEDFWQDVIYRHGNWPEPRRMMREAPGVYQHCLGNFWGMIYQMMVERQMFLRG